VVHNGRNKLGRCGQLLKLTEDFKCRTLQYNTVTTNVERRWHESFVIGNKFFVHGGWNDGGPLDDLLCLDMGIVKNSPVVHQIRLYGLEPGHF
jgi:hypothetical protein